jgi:hypothetical protein
MAQKAAAHRPARQSSFELAAAKIPSMVKMAAKTLKAYTEEGPYPKR